MTFRIPTYALSYLFLGRQMRRYIAGINGQEHIPIGNGFVIAANHIDYLDGIYIGMIISRVTNRRVYFISRTNNYRLYRSTIKIPKENKERVVVQSIERLRRGFSICYFPEGARNDQPELLPFKTGVVRTAIIGHVPVLPIGLIGPSGASYRDSILLLLRGRGRLTINIGAPISWPAPVGELTREQLDAATGQVAETVARLSGKLYNH
ncbi:MAG: lysophospholipid acyltransferase family protein [Patescibacteria group bacterium]